MTFPLRALASLRSFLLGASLFGLAACSPPEEHTDVAQTLVGDAIVFEGTSAEVVSWSARFDVVSAPAGDYFAFASDTRPTSLAGLATFKVEDCAGAAAASCDVAGLGHYAGRATLTTAGKLSLNAHGAGDNAHQKFFVFARRAASGTPASSASPALALSATISIVGDGRGCGKLDAPDVKADPL